MLFYLSSDLITQVSAIIDRLGLSWEEVTKEMKSWGPSFLRQVRRPDPNPSSEAFFCCLRVLKLELSGCRHLHLYTQRLNQIRCDAALSFRDVADLLIPQSGHRVVARVLTGKRTPRMRTLLSLTCALDLHPVIGPSS